MVSKRFRGKINIQRPQKTFFRRAVVEAVCAPIYPRRIIVNECREEQERKHLQLDVPSPPEIHPYQDLIARELFQRLDSSKMVIFCHANAHTQQDIFDTRVALHRKDINYKQYGKKLFRLATDGTKFASLQRFFNTQFGCTSFMYSSEIKVAEALEIIGKFRRVIVLCGFVEDRLLDRDQLVEYSRLPNIDIVRAQFANELNSAGSSILNKLQAHPSNLCTMLESRAKMLGECSDKSTKKDGNAVVKPAGESATSPDPSTKPDN